MKIFKVVTDECCIIYNEKRKAKIFSESKV